MARRLSSSLFVLSVGLVALSACATGDTSGGDVTPTKVKDSGAQDSSEVPDSQQATNPPQPDSAVTNPPDDSYVPPDDTYLPPDDTYVPPADTYVPPADTYVPPTGGTTGKSCTSSAECGTAGDICAAFPSPVCAGMPCTNPADSSSSSGYDDYSACDSDAGVCAPDTSKTDGSGFCVPKCSVPLTGGAATGCLTGDTCIPEILPSGATAAIGSCEGGSCLSDSDCSAVSSTYTKCQKETLNCVQPTDYKTYTASTGTACSLSSTGTSTPSCVCLANSGASGYCINVCITGDATHGCASGYTCNPWLQNPPFTKVPTGVTGYCLKPCTTSCPTGTTCTALAGGSFCVP